MNKKIVWEHLNYEEPPKDQLDDEDEYNDSPVAEIMDFPAFMQEEPPRLVTTPFGLFHVDDIFNPMKQYVWWIGHTNFNVSPKVINTINNTTGVEWLKVVSRYRFMIAVGKAFDFSYVRSEIEKNLEILSNTVDEQEDIIQELKANHSKWAVLYYDDDTYHVIVDDEYDDGISELKEFIKHNNGRLVTHNDV